MAAGERGHPGTELEDAWIMGMEGKNGAGLTREGE